MFDVANAIDDLEKVEANKSVKDNWFRLYEAKNQIEAVFNQSPYSTHLRVSRDTGGELHKAITDILGDGSKNDRMVEEFEVRAGSGNL
ncbi:hypothetical protein, partial [Bradyrhizobium diazoefficiens]|uniref:hypothetical protein n=1 Tax=Bradyrhizobium diazoefficiens TaxID=1355477 RepID=UPI0012FEC4FA